MFMMQGGARFHLEGLKNITMANKRCLLIFVPQVYNRVVLPAGTRITTIDLHLNLEYLSVMVPYFKDLDAFVNQVHKDRPAALWKCPGPISADILEIITGLYSSRFSEREQMLFLEQKMMTWMVKALQMPYPQAKPKVRITPAERNRIIEVFAFITDNLHEVIPLHKQARMAAMNALKYKYGFSEIFNSSVHKAVIEERLKKACGYLKDSDWPVTEIAYKLGYDSLASFSRAFKKKYGYSPTVFR